MTKKNTNLIDVNIPRRLCPKPIDLIQTVSASQTIKNASN